MEKISNAALAAHLRSQREAYNSLYTAQELASGAIDPALLHRWIVHVIEPVVTKVSGANADSLPAVFRAFYTELLRLAGNGLLVAHEADYSGLWSSLPGIPQLLATHPVRILSALHTALQTVRSLKPQRTQDWISRMSTWMPECRSVEEVLACGRMAAWWCGLAHLRSRCREQWPTLRAELRQSMEALQPDGLPVQALLDRTWAGYGEPTFAWAPGGFTGLGGVFAQPPVLAEAGGQVIAKDNYNKYILFTDKMGWVLLPGDAGLNDKPSVCTPRELKKKLGRLADFDDISSCVVKGGTAYITRQSSHHIFVYGWNEAD